jgi:hypothetical protein
MTTTETFKRYARVQWTDDEGKNHSGHVLSDEGDELVHVESNEIWDYDDDGMDEDGSPIMRPLYERYRVERERVVMTD